MELKNLKDSGKMIEVGEHYMADDGAVIYRCNGATTATYWVRDNDMGTVYGSVVDAYHEFGGRELARLRKRTQACIVASLRYAMA